MLDYGRAIGEMSTGNFGRNKLLEFWWKTGGHENTTCLATFDNSDSITTRSGYAKAAVTSANDITSFSPTYGGATMLLSHAGLEEVGTHLEAGGQAMRELRTLPSWILVAVSQRSIERRKTVDSWIDPRIKTASGEYLKLGDRVREITAYSPAS